LAAGVDVRTVAGRLGHRSASTTLNVYAHFVHDADEQAAEVLARLLDEGGRSRSPNQNLEVSSA
jgi:integrase